MTQVNTATNTITGQLRIAACRAGAFSADGHYLYLPVTRGIVAVNTVTGTAGSPAPGGGCASDLFLANDGRTLYSTGLRARVRTTITKFAVSAASLSPAWSTVVDQQADDVVMALSSNGATLFVGRDSHESITPVNTATSKAGRVIADGLDNSQLALVIPAGRAPGWLAPISAASGTAGRADPAQWPADRAGVRQIGTERDRHAVCLRRGRSRSANFYPCESCEAASEPFGASAEVAILFSQQIGHSTCAWPCLPC